MAEGKKLAEELRESFPSLDDFSARTLLGGGPVIPGPIIGWNEDGSPVYGDPFTLPSGGNSQSGGHPTASTGSTGGGSGSDYFGDWDFGDDYGDFGFGEGWGDQDGGTDSNPGSSEGGNGQNSSGDQGNHSGHSVNPYNVARNLDLDFTLKNNSSHTIAYMYEDTSNIFYLAPGESTNNPFEAINVLGDVFKLCGGYGWVIVTDQFYMTNYFESLPDWMPGSWGYQQDNGGYLSAPPPGQEWWQPIFDALP